MMVSGSGVRQVPRFLLCGFGGIRRAILETEAIVSGFENVAAVGETVEQRGRHLWVAEHGGHSPKRRLVVTMTLGRSKVGR